MFVGLKASRTPAEGHKVWPGNKTIVKQEVDAIEKNRPQDSV